MRDELNNSNKATKNECLILNIDHSDNNGTHWTCLFIEDGVSHYFDSFGFEPPLEVKKYSTEPRVYSSFEIQQLNEVICGHYCIYILHRMSNGVDFYNVLGELYEYNNLKNNKRMYY
jgi:hypothetical protein